LRNGETNISRGNLTGLSAGGEERESTDRIELKKNGEERKESSGSESLATGGKIDKP